MGHLTHDEFFSKLTELFDYRKNQDHGTINLVQKRLSYNTPSQSTETDLLTDLCPSTPLPVLIRATNAKGKDRRKEKVKLSTIIEPADLEAFYGRYADVCKKGMGALKPRDRTKRKKQSRKKKAPTAGGPGVGAGGSSMMAIP
ncbi:signal recognition particle, SRP9/SRP14 subunit [Pseudoneurospora amorphoporcata]|uniref:Signal recognition particle subunit SRP14 n=1 Tax=Pseudoneurospora amorphoporcata TaxID=241081 RepID=A0AAN6NUZ0_9PEZI|nr:signal recognition particle, SRP9/SRP14 subunit [Pseudoneurospora amorphoporcata]